MSPLAYALLAVSVTSVLIVIRRLLQRLPLPPGPEGTLLTGVKSLLPPSEPWKHYWAWSEDFAASIISFRVYTTRIVVLNDANAVHDLLGKRAEIYSDRPRHAMFTDICDRKNTVFNISSLDERHKQYRKLLHTGLNPLAVKNYWSVMESEIAVLLDQLSACPENFVQHLRRCSTAIIMKLAYGYSLTEDDRFIQVAEESSKISAIVTTPGRWLVNHYPILRFVPSFLPGAGWKRQGLVWRQRLKSLSDVPHDWVKEQMVSGKFEPSFTSRHLQDRITGLPDAQHDDIVKWCAGGLYAGATDTTISALISFVLLMALHPEVQAKAHKELEEAFGKDLPNPADITKLSYLNAVYKEVMRYAPVANMAFAHSVIRDDEYRGYRIPKNSTVIANVWAIMHDPTLYPEPFTFSPERFLPSSESSKSNPYDQPQVDPRKFAYGFGHRKCPGKNFAETMLLLAMASILTKFDITLPSGATSPPIEFTTGITSHIKPFEICIKARSE